MNGSVRVSRPVYTIDDYIKKYGSPEKKKRTFSGYMTQKCTLKRIAKLLCSYLPVIKVVRKYKVKEYIISDILAGLTVSFIHLPQGLAFGILASLQPIYGLYTTFFPVLFYTLFGTSPYISYGPTANMAILTRTVVEREANSFIANYKYSGNGSYNVTDIGPSEEQILQVKVGAAAACSVLSGLFLATLGFFKLGFLTSYLSTSFIGGFTTAAAVFVASSQVPKLFGIKTNSYSGAGGLVFTYIDLFRKLGGTRIPELVISIVCITLLLSVKVGINEKYKSKLKFPIPIDFILAVVATMISYFAKFEYNFDVVTVGPIPSGFNAPTLPNLVNAADFISDAIVIAVVSLAMTITFAKLTAKKHGVKIDESQELFAYGASNVLSGFFGCFPSANASPRTGVLSSLGAKTTLNGLVTVSVFLLIVLVVGKLFVYLPASVLASMIIVSTKDLVLQYRNLPKIWKINKYDFTIWIVTNISATLLDLYYGLIIGLLCSFVSVVVQNQVESGYLINVSSTEDILYKLDGQGINEIDGRIKIFRFPVNLYFATAEQFKKEIYKIAFNPEIYVKRKKKEKVVLQVQNGSIIHAFEIDHSKELKGSTVKMKSDIYKPDYIIIDCSMMSYIDMAGANMLQEVIQQYSKFDVVVYLTGVQECSLNVLTSAGFFDAFPRSYVLLDVFDAIAVAKSHLSYVCHL